MERICVFCGSNAGARPEYVEAAAALGRAMVRRGVGLVYGGGRVGLMGTIADTVMAEGGEAIGIIPHALKMREVAHEGLSELHVVGSMHERKGMMSELSDAFITMPGGFGTMEEFFETVTWGMLGIHRKPCAVLNVAGYYDGLLSVLDRFVEERFARPEHRAFIISDHDPDRLLEMISSYKTPDLPTWIVEGET